MNQAYASNNAIDYTTHLMMKKDTRRNKSLIGWLSCFSIVLAAAVQNLIHFDYNIWFINRFLGRCTLRDSKHSRYSKQ